MLFTNADQDDERALAEIQRDGIEEYKKVTGDDDPTNAKVPVIGTGLIVDPTAKNAKKKKGGQPQLLRLAMFRELQADLARQNVLGLMRMNGLHGVQPYRYDPYDHHDDDDDDEDNNYDNY